MVEDNNRVSDTKPTFSIEVRKPNIYIFFQIQLNQHGTIQFFEYQIITLPQQQIAITLKLGQLKGVSLVT